MGPIDFLQPPFLDEDANPESPERPQFSYNQDKSNIEEKLQEMDQKISYFCLKIIQNLVTKSI